MIDVAIIDDHPLFLEALRQIIQRSMGQARVVGAYRSVQAFHRAGVVPDAMLLDLNLNGEPSFHNLLSTVYRYPGCEIIVVSGTEDPGIVQRAMLLGARAFVPKSLPLDGMREAMVSALAGERWCPAGTPPIDEPFDANALSATFAGLSPMRRRVAAGVILGLQNKQIAYDLHISHGTVRNQVTEILAAFGLRRRTELVSLMQGHLALPGAAPEFDEAEVSASEAFVFNF